MDEIRATIDMQNNESHTVIGVATETFITRSNRDGKQREFSIGDFHENFRVGYCFSIHKAQGDTITDDFTIWEHDQMSRRHQYTAMTRAKSKQQISLGILPKGYETGKARNTQRTRKGLAAKIARHKQDDREEGRSVCDVTVDMYHQMIEECGRLCAHCGEEVKVINFHKNDDKQVTLDRINNDMGHTYDNVVIACRACNVRHFYEQEHTKRAITTNLK
jgi:hypothetical protein